MHTYLYCTHSCTHTLVHVCFYIYLCTPQNQMDTLRKALEDEKKSHQKTILDKVKSESELRSLQRQHTGLQERYTALNTGEFDALMQKAEKLQSYQERFLNQNLEMDQLSETNVKLRQRIREMTAESDDLNTSFSDYREKFTVSSESQLVLERKEQLFEEHEQRFKDASRTISQLESEKQKLSDELAELHAQVRCVTSENEELQEEVESTSEQLMLAAKDVDTLDLRAKEQETTILSVQQTLSYAQASEASLKSKVTALSGEIAQLKEQLHQSQSQNTSSNNTNNNNNNNELQQQLVHERLQHTLCAQQLEKTQSELAQAKQASATLEQALRLQAAANKNIATNDSNKRAFEGDMDVHKSNGNENGDKHNAYGNGKDNNSHAELTRKIHEVTAERDALEIKLRKKEVELKKVTETVKQKLAQINKVIRGKNNKIKALEQTITQLRA